MSQALPSYPDSALEFGVVCSARLLYHIETSGSATLVRLEWDVSPPEQHLEAFEAAIREAVATWEFTPATRLNPTKRPDGGIRYVAQPIPKAGRAIVRFRVEGGVAIVE